MKYIDLCAGTGAFSFILDQYGHNCVFANDFVKESEIIYKHNFPTHNFSLLDLNDIDVKDIPTHDILTAGFPCQPFSIAGKQKGFKDKRSNIFWKILEIMENKLPSIVIFENVKNLLTHNKGETLPIICENITKIGYKIKYQILDTCKVTNIPHHRERLYIICFRSTSLYESFNFDFPRIVNKSIKDIINSDIDDKYYYTNRYKVYDIINTNVTKKIDENVLYQYRLSYVRENKSKQCPTLTANMGSGGHNVPILRDDKGIRKLTPRECFLFQGFPSEYKIPNTLSDSKLYKLIGNAVSIPIIELIIKKITNH